MSVLTVLKFFLYHLKCCCGHYLSPWLLRTLYIYIRLFSHSFSRVIFISVWGLQGIPLPKTTRRKWIPEDPSAHTTVLHFHADSKIRISLWPFFFITTHLLLYPPKNLRNRWNQLGTVVHTYNPSTWEAEAGGQTQTRKERRTWREGSVVCPYVTDEETEISNFVRRSPVYRSNARLY